MNPKRLNALSEKTCAELIVTIKRRKLTERDHSIKARLAEAREQQKKYAVVEEKSTGQRNTGKAMFHSPGR